MSNFLQANLPSDDEADEDFNPEEGKSLGVKSRVSTREKEESASGDKVESSHGKAARKARVDALWEQLNGSKKPRLVPAPTTAQDTTMQQGVKSQPAHPCTTTPPSTDAARAADSEAAARSRRTRELAAAAIGAARASAAAAAAQMYGEARVTEVRRFAGEDVSISRAATAGEVARGVPSGAAAPEKAGGLDAMLASLSGPKKVNVLDKTRSDWTEFKAGDGAIEEELEAHKRSGGQYLDKQAFLQAADVRQYETERDRRMRGR